MKVQSERKCAVLVLGFNRPDKVRSILEEVFSYGPSALYFAVDGPRNDAEAIQVALVQDALKEFEWRCPVHTLFAETNRGAKQAIEASIDFLFTVEDEGLILEDDCLPSGDFFRFGSAALDKYRSVPQVGMVSGTNFLTEFDNGPFDAVFSDGHIWGWGTWKDRWVEHRAKATTSADFLNAPAHYGAGWSYRRRLILEAERGSLDAWDIPWLLFLAERGLWSVIPTRNLISNVGHGADGTHTTGGSRFANLPLLSLRPELRMPDQVVPSRKYQRTYAFRLNTEDKLHRFRRPLVSLVRRALSALRFGR